MAEDLEGRLAAVLAEVAALRAEVALLRRQVDAAEGPPADHATPVQQSLLAQQPPAATVAADAAAAAKVALFRSLFAGRADVYAQPWTHNGREIWLPQVHREPGQSWKDANHARRYRPLTDEVVREHLSGARTVGLYPMLPEDTCRLVVADFDGASWRLDAQAYAQVAAAADVPVAVEISRSGEGAHVWIVFTQPVAAADARALATGLLRETIAVRGELGVDSYDRLIPAQDHLPVAGRGLGNLIALPLQGTCRHQHTTVFVDPVSFTEHADQWAFLAALGTLTPSRLADLLDELGGVAVGPQTRWVAPRRQEPAPPPVVNAHLGGMLAIRRAGLPPSLLAALKHAACLANPEFYKNENLRISNHNTPRFVRCYVEDLEFVYLPRGMVPTAQDLLTQAGSRLEITDRRASPASLTTRFVGVLRPAQRPAVAELSRHTLGVLEAPPGSGKTVMGCALIAHHRLPTLVLVDRGPLMDQWRDRITTLLDLPADQVGQLGGGKRRLTGVVDLAMLQTLARADDLAGRLSGYGLVIVDEVHHTGAPTVERIVRAIPARYWVGLTATPYRRDGLDEIIFLHCGPKRYVIPLVDPADPAPIPRWLHVHHTDFTLPDELDAAAPGSITAVFAALTTDAARNTQICDDVAAALTQGRHCLVLTRPTAHVKLLAAELAARGHPPHTLYGTMQRAQRTATLKLLADPPTSSPLLLVATDRYVGEGFDCPPLDTLFLAHPSSYKGSMVQHVGRILRAHPDKTSIAVHDYVDGNVAPLAAMWRRRSRSYPHLGFNPAEGLDGAAPA